MVVPSISRAVAFPAKSRQRMSALPSPSKSAIPEILHWSGMIPVMRQSVLKEALQVVTGMLAGFLLASRRVGMRPKQFRRMGMQELWTRKSRTETR